MNPMPRQQRVRPEPCFDTPLNQGSSLADFQRLFINSDIHLCEGQRGGKFSVYIKPGNWDIFVIQFENYVNHLNLPGRRVDYVLIGQGRNKLGEIESIVLFVDLHATPTEASFFGNPDEPTSGKTGQMQQAMEAVCRDLPITNRTIVDFHTDAMRLFARILHGPHKVFGAIIPHNYADTRAELAVKKRIGNLDVRIKALPDNLFFSRRGGRENIVPIEWQELIEEVGF